MNKDSLKKKLEDIKEFIFNLQNCTNIPDEKKFYTDVANSFFQNSPNVALAYIHNLIPNRNYKFILTFSGNKFEDSPYLPKLMKELEQKHETKFCFEKKDGKVFDVKRLDEDLNFVSVSEEEHQNDFIRKRVTCTERKIIEYLKAEQVGELRNQEESSGHSLSSEEVVALQQEKFEGEIYIYTHLEPCMYCREVMESVKNDNLTLKVFYSEYRDTETRIDNRIEEFLFKTKNKIKEFLKGYLKISESSSNEHHKKFESINDRIFSINEADRIEAIVDIIEKRPYGGLEERFNYIETQITNI